MFPQRRMTTDTPDGNYSQALNLFVRGEDGWVQMPSRSISLNDYMKQLIKAHNADIDTEGTPEEFDMTLCEHLFDGPETIEGLLAEHYTLSWALASLRDKLKHYEDARIPEIMPEGLQTIERAIGTYGKDAQLTKAVEEMSELTKALCKFKECKRKYDTPFNRETQEVCSNIEEECLEHEKTHSPHFDGSTNEDIAKELDALGANACSFRVGDCVMGMTVHSFKNLMSVAARALRGGADNAGKE